MIPGHRSRRPTEAQFTTLLAVTTVAVRSGGETLVTAETPPFEFEIQRSDIDETPTGKEFRVIYSDADGDVLNRQIRSV